MMSSLSRSFWCAFGASASGAVGPLRGSHLGLIAQRGARSLPLSRALGLGVGLKEWLARLLFVERQRFALRKFWCRVHLRNRILHHC